MTTYRIYETCTGQFVGRSKGSTPQQAIAAYAAEAGKSVSDFTALVEPRRPTKDEPTS